jgi:hypothetical protein
MLRSMFSGVSGLRSHQTMMDVIGNNIARQSGVRAFPTMQPPAPEAPTRPRSVWG